MLKLWFDVHSVRVAFVAIEVAFAFESMLVCVAVGCVAVASAATSLTSACTHRLKQAGAKHFAREPCKHECARNPMMRSATNRVRT